MIVVIDRYEGSASPPGDPEVMAKDFGECHDVVRTLFLFRRKMTPTLKKTAKAS
jgi:hypothetical protein